jgi:hypothetical protein
MVNASPRVSARRLIAVPTSMQDVAQCGEVGGWGARASEQSPGTGYRADQFAGVGVGELSEPGGAVS